VIARILALLARPDELTAARAELRQTHKALSTEQMLTTGLTTDVKKLTRQLAALTDEVERLRLIADEAERLHHVIELGRAGIAVVS
jgi:hypothetical protein